METNPHPNVPLPGEYFHTMRCGKQPVGAGSVKNMFGLMRAAVE